VAVITVSAITAVEVAVVITTAAVANKRLQKEKPEAIASGF
jgi:hypothetical protein